jgi:hypothetical protein
MLHKAYEFFGASYALKKKKGGEEGGMATRDTEGVSERMEPSDRK